ncbi:MAG: hypothetical protein KKD29_01320 [Candidatus Omnitrophica bacterium]|nr:hypothetical protein [Candidatus Omnitrophota bacterium]MBU4488701.1 hypothetical protein [Candidatus Omnitrophota bacterium]MCG2705730.1 hypothetical protein [Candidatus Omnitrophota bacterium]
MVNKLFINTEKGFAAIRMIVIAVILGVLIIGIFVKFAHDRRKVDKQLAVAITKINLENLRKAVISFYAMEKRCPRTDLSNLADGTSPSGRVHIQGIPEDGVTGSRKVVNYQGNSGGWYWDNIGKKVHVNLTGNDVNGKPYSEY